MTNRSSKKPEPYLVPTTVAGILAYGEVPEHVQLHGQVDFYRRWLSRHLLEEPVSYEELSLIYETLMKDDDLFNYFPMTMMMVKHRKMDETLMLKLIAKYRSVSAFTACWAESKWVNIGDFTTFFKIGAVATKPLSYNPALSLENIHRFMELEPRDMLKKNLLANPNLPADIMFTLMEEIIQDDSSYAKNRWEVYSSAAMNPNLNDEDIKRIISYVRNDIKTSDTRRSMYLKEYLESEVVYKLMFHEATKRVTLLDAYKLKMEADAYFDVYSSEELYSGTSILSAQLRNKVQSMPEYEGWPKEWVEADFLTREKA